MTPGANPTRELETMNIRIPVRPRISVRRARWLAVLFFGLAALVMFAMFAVLNGCTTTGQGQDVHLKGSAGEMFRKLTGANGMTLSERVTIYGTEDPPSARLVCHEERHKLQARVIGDALAALQAIDDDEVSRAAAWIAVYSIEHLQRGYEGSRFEIEAKNVCKDVQ